VGAAVEEIKLAGGVLGWRIFTGNPIMEPLLIDWLHWKQNGVIESRLDIGAGLLSLVNPFLISYLSEGSWQC
jgi:hypothetical protein